MRQRVTSVRQVGADGLGDDVRLGARLGRTWPDGGLPKSGNHDRRHPPSGARLLQVSHARPDCPSSAESRSLGWLVAIGAAVFLCVLGLGLLANRMAEPVREPETATIVWVQPGESVWDVARRAAPDDDPGTVVARIRDLNGLTGDALKPGQPLRVPVGD